MFDFIRLLSIFVIETVNGKKRGLAIVPTMYGIAFGQTFLNQGSALVRVYTDGSVLLSHGGMEMGQVSLLPLLGRHGSVSLCRVERENKMAATYNVLAFKR